MDEVGEFTGVWVSEVLPKLRVKMAEYRFAWLVS